MSRLNRLMWTGLVLGVAACGDDVTVPPPAITVTVTPDGAEIPVGGTLQMAATASGGPGGAPTFAWSSSNNATATVSNTGLVTGVAVGAVGITATATIGSSTGAGSATVNVVSTDPQLPPTVSISSITSTVCTQQGFCADLPVNMAAVKGQINVHVNLERNNNPIQRVELVMKSPTGEDTVVASQSFSASAPVEASPELVPEALTMSVNTAAFDSATGAVAFTNGTNGVIARAIGAAGTETAQNAVQFTLANVGGFGIFVSADTSGTGGTGLLWTGGDLNVKAVGVVYTAGATVASVTIDPDLVCDGNADGDFDDVGIDLNGPLGPKSGPEATWASDVALPGGSMNLVSTAGGCRPGITASVLSNGQAGPTSLVGDTTLVRHDNEAPAASTVAIPLWVNAAFLFEDVVTAVGSDGLGSGAVETHVFAGATLTGAAGSCNVTGLTEAVQGDAFPATTTSTAYKTRVVTSDAVGNATCFDGTTFGADFVAPTGSIASSSPANGAAFNAEAAAPNWDFTGSDNASGFNPDSAVFGIIKRLNANGTTTCVLGGGTGCSVDSARALNFDAFDDETTDGYYTFDPIKLSDQAGNALTFTGRTFLLDQTPASITGGLTLQALYTGNATATFATAPNAATDNMDLNNVYGTLTYPGPNVLQFPPQSLGTFGAPLEKSATVNLSIPDFIRCLNVAGDYGTATNKPTTVTLNVSDFAQATATPLAFPIPAVNVENCNGAGNIPGVDILSFGMLAPDYGTGKVNVDVDGANVGTTSSTTVTLKAEAEVALNTSVDPFTRVDFYYLNPAGNWEKFGSATGVLRQTSTPERFYTYTLSPAWDPPAGLLPNATVVAIGVDAQGDAVFSTSVAIVAVP